MRPLPTWIPAIPVLLTLVTMPPARAQDAYTPYPEAYPADVAYPQAEGAYSPLAEGYPQGYGGMGAACADGSCAIAGSGWCGSPACGGEDGTCGPRLFHGGLRRRLGQMHQCAAARAYMLPVGRRDCSGCPSSSGGPYGDGTCAVHWFDVEASYLYWTREDVARRIDFASDDIQGPIVLSTDNLGFDEEPGFRVTGTWQIGASSHVEATYFGTFNWHSSAAATSENDNLYSVMSDFGVIPAGGFLQTDQAAVQYIDYSSDLNNVELNWRNHWVGANYWLQGSVMMGVRYLKLNEDFAYLTQVAAHTDPITTLPRGPAGMNYHVGTKNHLIGYQLGGDLFASVLPGLIVGGNLSAGIFGNHASQRTTVVATNLDPDVRESATHNDAAFVGQGGVTVIYQIRPWLSLRGGYELLYLDGVALAPENFNAEAPFVGPPRNVSINDNGSAFYHGLTAGLEWLW